MRPVPIESTLLLFLLVQNFLVKNKRMSNIAWFTKLINSATKLFDQKESFSDFSKFNMSLEEYIQHIH